MLKRLFLAAFLPVLFAAVGNTAAAQTAEEPEPAVQAILFYSPTCPHCHQVINELLLPMQGEYGEQLQIIGIDTSNEAGQALYGRAIEHFDIPVNRLGVPTLIVRDTILVGGQEIPERFPEIFEEGLAAGGIGWPDIPDLALIIPDLPPSADADSGESVAENPQPKAMVTAASADEASMADGASSTGSLEEASRDTTAAEADSDESVAQDPPADPVGFTLAWVVLIGMIVALFYALRQIFVFGSRAVHELPLQIRTGWCRCWRCWAWVSLPILPMWK